MLPLANRVLNLTPRRDTETRPPETVSLDNGEVLFEQGDTGRDRGSPGRRAKARGLRRTEFGTPHAAARLPVGRWSAGRPDPRLNVDARWPLHSQSDGGTIGRSGIASPTGVRSLTVPVDPGERVGRPTAASRSPARSSAACRVVRDSALELCGQGEVSETVVSPRRSVVETTERGAAGPDRRIERLQSGCDRPVALAAQLVPRQATFAWLVA